MVKRGEVEGVQEWPCRRGRTFAADALHHPREVGERDLRTTG